MNLREKIGNMPVWKAAIIWIIPLFILLYGIEIVFFDQVFKIIKNTTTSFEHVFQEDEYDLAMSKLDRLLSKEKNGILQPGDLPFYCNSQEVIAQMKVVIALPYVEKKEELASYLKKALEEYQKQTNKKIALDTFYPAQCKVGLR